MVNNGIVQYDEVYKTVNGNLNATREQALVMLARAFGISSQDTAVPFSDVALISDWAMDSVKGLYANGLVSGYTDGTLNPKGNITRAEFFTMIDRLISK